MNYRLDLMILSWVLKSMSDYAKLYLMFYKIFNIVQIFVKQKNILNMLYFSLILYQFSWSIFELHLSLIIYYMSKLLSNFYKFIKILILNIKFFIIFALNVNNKYFHILIKWSQNNKFYFHVIKFSKIMLKLIFLS